MQDPAAPPPYRPPLAAPTTRARLASEALVGAIARRPGFSVAAMLLAIVGVYTAYAASVGWDLSQPPVDNRIEIWFFEDDPAIQRYTRFKEVFGNDEDVLIGVRDAEGVFSPATLTLIDELSERLSRLPRVRGVTSLATVLHTGNDADGAIEIERMYRGPVGTPEEAARIRERFRSNRLYADDMLAKDERLALVNVRIEDSDDFDLERPVVLGAVRAVVEALFREEGRAQSDWVWGGVGVINVTLNELSARESNTFFSLALAVMALFLLAFLRRFTAVAAAMLGVVAAVLGMVGVYLALGFKLNLITSVLPVLVLVIGLTDSVYIIITYYQEREGLEAAGLSKLEAIQRAVGFCVLPCLFNTVAASLGFLSFLGSSMPILQDFGLFAGVGLVLAFAGALVFTTSFFVWFDIRPARRTQGELTRAALVRLTGVALRRPRTVCLAALGVLVVAIGGITRLEVDNNTIEYFYPDHPLRQADALLEREFGPYLPLDLFVDTGAPGAIQEPAVLRAMDSVERERVAAERHLGSSVSLAGVVKQLNLVFGGTPDAFRIPDERELVEQELLFYDPLRADDPLTLVDPTFQLGRLTFRASAVSAREAGAMIDRLERASVAAMPPGTSLEPTGLVPLYVKQTEHILWGQVTSLTFTFLVVFAIIGLFFRSARYALLSIPPNTIPVLCTLGFMGYAGIALDSASVLIGSISLAIAVDDTIHMLFKFKHLHDETGDPVLALRRTVHTLGAAIVATSCIIALGFAVISLAELRTLAMFGLLAAVTVFATLLAELVVTPAVILTFRGALPPPAGPAAP